MQANTSGLIPQPAITQRERAVYTHTHAYVRTHKHTHITDYGWIDGRMNSWTEREAGDVAVGCFEEDLRKRGRELGERETVSVCVLGFCSYTVGIQPTLCTWKSMY